MMGFFAGLANLVPFLKLLLDVFNPKDGKEGIRGARILGMLLSIAILFSVFITILYFETYRAHVEVVSRLEHMTASRDEYREWLFEAEADLKVMRNEHMECLKTRLPYEDLLRLPNSRLSPTVTKEEPFKDPKKTEHKLPPVTLRSEGFRTEIINRMNKG